MSKYIDKTSIIFGAGAVIGAVIFSMVVNPKLPASLGGGRV